MEERLVMYLVGVPLLGIAAQWLAWRLRLPAILLLLGCGIALGQFVNPDELLSEITGGARPNGPRLLFPVVSLAVAVILFEGGMSLRFHELKYSGPVVLRLVTIGAAATWLLATLAAKYAFDLSTRIAILVGAILVVTGPTVVVPLLRQIRPSRRVGSIAKWEGIVIDPIGAVLAILVFEQVLAAAQLPSAGGVLLVLLRCAGAALILGFLAARLLVEAVKRYWLPDYLHGAAFLAVALGAFAASNAFQAESGLATITLMGIILANQRSISIQHVVEFNEHLGVLLISCLFVVLGSRLNLKEIIALDTGAFIFLFLLVFVVRPVSVFAATVSTVITIRERLFLAFLAPRGIVAAAVASVFALKVATIASEERQLAQQAEQLVPITFLAIVGTVAVYGLLAAPLARWLGLADPNPQGLLIAGASPWIRDIAKALKDEGITVLLLDTNDAQVSDARMNGLAAECMSVLSEAAQNELDLSGIGRLLAMTPNEEVNAMATRELAHFFGRANVYQLPDSRGESARRALARHLYGRPLFERNLTYREIARRIELGAVMKKTKITEEFRWCNFRDQYGPSATLLFVFSGKNSISICTADQNIEPKPGQSIIALVDTDEVAKSSMGNAS
jgi:NhaP-type Na+/H+ or K+/H+ antiporter